MMRAIIIIVEGPTEEEFVNNSLRPYFISQNIYDVRAIKMQTSPGHKGGVGSYQRFKRDAINYLKSEGDILVTSLIDYFRLPTDFPNFDISKNINDSVKRAVFLEKAMLDDIGYQRFVPYLQLHEFEGLLFAENKGFEYIPNIPDKNRDIIIKTINEYPNPELINEGAETAPSKRLEKLIPGYQKTLHGPIIALENGIYILLKKCPRFNNWINELIAKMQS